MGNDVIIREVTLVPITAPSKDSKPLPYFQAVIEIEKLRAKRVKGSPVVHGIVEVGHE